MQRTLLNINAQESCASYKVRLVNGLSVITHVFMVYEHALDVVISEGNSVQHTFWQWYVLLHTTNRPAYCHISAGSVLIGQHAKRAASAPCCAPSSALAVWASARAQRPPKTRLAS